MLFKVGAALRWHMKLGLARKLGVEHARGETIELTLAKPDA